MQNEKCKIKRSIVTLFVLVTGWLFTVAQEVNAAVYVFEIPQEVAKVGQEIEARLKVDTEGQRINVFNVAIVLPEELEFRGINKEDSVVNLWVQEPNFVETSRILTFIGGVPGGAAGGKLKLLGVRLGPKQAGTFKLKVSEKSEAYLNDGFGTPVSVQAPEAVLVVEKAGLVNRSVGLIVVLVAVLIVGFLSWWLWHKNKRHRQGPS